MTYATRKPLYQKIETIRKRPLLTYVTSSRYGPGAGMIGADVIPEFCDQINAIPKEKEDVDLLIVSNGGDPSAAWRIMSLLRNRFKKISVLLPYQAYSAATLIALGADEILMHPFSNLGPVDPQLNIQPKNGKEQTSFPADTITYFVNFIRDDLKIKDDEKLLKAVEELCKEVSPLDIGTAKKSTILSISLGEKLLNTHMENAERAKEIAEKLAKSFYDHGYSIDRNEARDMGLPVQTPGTEIETLMWEIWLDFEKEMKCRQPFSPLQTAMEQVPFQKAFSIPNKTLFDNEDYAVIMSKLPQGVTDVICTFYHAALESISLCSGYETVSKLSIRRLPDLNIQYSLDQIDGKWSKRESW